MTLGQRIQELRKQAGLSQEALGEALGVSRQAVSKWEGDNGIPELDTLIAMSRLFGITVGQLLGVETPEEKPEEESAETTGGFTEEQVEEILRRYVEESRRQESVNQNTVGNYPIGSWIIAACAVILAVVVAVVTIGKVREVKERLNTLWTNVMDVEEIVSNTRNQVGGLADELRGVIEEQNSLISSFDYEVVAFDVEKETVDLKLTTALKTYTAGSKVQFVLSWLKTDDTAGELTTDPVEGPKFETVVTIPMNFHLDIGVEIILPDGTIQSQKADVVYGGMHSEEFKVQLRTAGMAAHGNDGKLESISWDGEFYSQWPDLLYPTMIETRIVIKGEEFLREGGMLRVTGSGTYHCQWNGVEFPEPVAQEDLELWYIVTDNYGRQESTRLT